MAFFFNGEKEYFSFSLEPNKNKKSYVFLLSSKQSYISKIFIQFIFWISVLIFFLALYLVLNEIIGWNYKIPSGNNKELLILSLSGCACILAFFEFVLFLWIKRNPNSMLDERSRLGLKEILILKNKSLMAYLAFLLCMTMPFILIGALPGGFAKFFYENIAGKSGISFFLAQLLMFYFLIAALILRSVFLLKNKV